MMGMARNTNLICKMRIKVSSENVRIECHFLKQSAYQTTILSRSYNKSQRDALFLNFILVKNSTCFGQIYCLLARSGPR
jgi:hypothetical protein